MWLNRFKMGTYYQLIFLGNTLCDACLSIRQRFFELLKERGLDASCVAVLDLAMVKEGIATAGASGYSSIWPAFVFYFGGTTITEECLAVLQYLKGNADAIYPVYFTENEFSDEVPEVLHAINGVLFKEDELDSIVNVAFEELRLLRKTRRVFISYKRSESLAVANQLFDVLSRRQFDVFLDSYSIRGAADFQAELHHRITDSDVLIQLNTPNFKDSYWCNDEISEANARRVGVLQINWPGVNPGDEDQLSAVRFLKDIDFRRKRWQRNTSTLKSMVLCEIASKTEEIRARNIAARQDNLTGEFVKEAERHGRTIIKGPTSLVELKNNDVCWYYIPTIGVPKSEDCHESVKMLERRNGKLPDAVYLIYDDLSILSSWIEHLRWLNEYLEVKTIQKREFASWLESTK